jgi:hypothetical protein
VRQNGFHVSSQLFHGLRIRHIDLAGQDLSALGWSFRPRLCPGVLLHVHQHQVHAQLGADAGAFQPKPEPAPVKTAVLPLKFSIMGKPF